METTSASYLKKLRFSISKKINSAFIGQYKSAFKGNGLLFDAVREYQYGDEIKNIDWKVSARMNHPFVKQYQEERELNILIMIDLSSSMDFGSERSKRDVLMEFMAVILFLAEYTNDRVSVLLFTDQVEWYFRPKRGRRYVLKVLNDIMHYKSSRKKTDIAGALEYASRVVKKRSVVFLISDFLDTGFYTILTRFSRKHDLIPVSISDPLERKFSFFGLTSLYDMEEDEVVFSTESSMDELAALADFPGDVLGLSTDLSIEHSVLEFFKKRNKKRLHA